MAFKKGKSGNPSGRPQGIQNKLTKNAKEAFELAFQTLGGAGGLSDWAELNKTDFYKLYSKLIPVEANVTGEIELKKVLVEFVGQKNANSDGSNTSDIQTAHNTENPQ